VHVTLDEIPKNQIRIKTRGDRFGSFCIGVGTGHYPIKEVAESGVPKRAGRSARR